MEPCSHLRDALFIRKVKPVIPVELCSSWSKINYNKAILLTENIIFKYTVGFKWVHFTFHLVLVCPFAVPSLAQRKDAVSQSKGFCWKEQVVKTPSPFVLERRGLNVYRVTHNLLSFFLSSVLSSAPVRQWALLSEPMKNIMMWEAYIQIAKNRTISHFTFQVYLNSIKVLRLKKKKSPNT